MEPVGQYLRRQREARRMSLEEVARATRVPLASMERLEAGQFDELPGEVFVRGFLRSYARAVELPCDEVLARYTASRRTAWVTPLPISAPVCSARSGRFGVAIAFVLLLFLFALALSIVLKPRSHDMPQELSQILRGHPVPRVLPGHPVPRVLPGHPVPRVRRATPAAASGAEPGSLDGYHA